MTWPLEGIRLLDFTFAIAGAFGTKYLAAFGAEVIKIEWQDIRGLGGTPPYLSPPGENADPMAVPNSRNRSAFFADTNSGKRGITLNMRHPEGKALFARLLRVSDGVMENFRAGTLEGWGFPYARMREIRPDIVYLQASGFGPEGPYSRFRSYGSIGQAVSGLTAQIGLPDRPPCGWGYSYMDITAAWLLALNMLAALRHRALTGQGHYLDTAQADASVYHTGTAVLDYSANGRPYTRSGNRSPHVVAAPHGAYRCADDAVWTSLASEERWIAITCFTDAHWRALVAEMGAPAWTHDPRFATLEARYAHQDELDRLVERWTRTQERYDLMARLQARGVPAGVCQDARDRIERDPQLAHLGFIRVVDHSEVGPHWVQGIPGWCNASRPDVGGRHGRGAPCYGEDNEYVFGEILGLSTHEMADLHAAGAIELTEPPPRRVALPGPRSRPALPGAAARPDPPDRPSLKGKEEPRSESAVLPESRSGEEYRSSSGLPLPFREGDRGVRSAPRRALAAALSDLRVLELGNENGEWAGRLLAANGAEVIRVEPPGGAPSRKIGPFYQGGLAEVDGNPEHSLYFWHYNLGKKSITLDLETEEGRRLFRELVKTADILLASYPPGYLETRGLGDEALRGLNPRLIHLSLTDFGPDGPWRDYAGSDLVHLALGGEMMMCGYPRNAEGRYDTPPMAGQMWHSRHMAGNLAAMHILAAAHFRDRTGLGQRIDLSLHEVAANATEWALPIVWGSPDVWAGPSGPERAVIAPILRCKDGKYIVMHAHLFRPQDWERHVAFLARHGAAADLLDPMYKDAVVRRSPEALQHLTEVTARFLPTVNAEEIWLEAQQAGVIWAALRAPEDNLHSSHFRARGVFGRIAHPELDRSFDYPIAPRAQGDLPWLRGARAPLLGEHNAEILGKLGVTAR